MKLSEQELRWLSRWEKRERQWLPFTRWVCIFNGIVTAAGGIYFLHRLPELGGSIAMGLLFVPILFIGMGGAWFGMAFSKWRGDFKLRLLMRLIREHVDKDA
jgi:hypothetical protein